MSKRDRKTEGDQTVVVPDAPEAASPGDARGETGLTPADPEPAAPSPDPLESLRRECGELKEQLLRRRAEFDNFRKRVEREQQQAGEEAVAKVLKALIPVLDNLDRALEAGGSAESLREGVELTRRELLAILEAQGVKVDEPIGQPFDPERHQALAHEPAPGFQEGTVVEVYGKGYSYRDRLLRPALVKVAKEAGPDHHKIH
jgi:molecular chaperone GrpE